jgi:hypothetical protein
MPIGRWEGKVKGARYKVKEAMLATGDYSIAQKFEERVTFG